MNDITFKHGVICDDIREEKNGKFLIVGMYTGALVALQLPVQIQIAFGVWAVVDGPGSYECEFEFVLEPDATIVGRVAAKFQIAQGDNKIFINLPKIAANIESEGYLVLRETKTEKEIIRLKVTTQPNGDLPHSSLIS